MSPIIQLTKGFETVVSEGDFVALSRFKWCALIRDGVPYAVRFEKGKLVSMHRSIMEAGSGIQVDHCNHDTLDNRRENLRLCTRTQNLRNRRSKQGASRFKGVSPSGPRWRVDIRENGRSKYIGTFSDESEAARKYDEVAKLHYGEFASLNFYPDCERQSS